MAATHYDSASQAHVHRRAAYADDMAWLRQIAGSAVSDGALRVAVGLTGFFNAASGLAFMSQDTLAAATNRSARATRRGLAELVAAGHLERRRGNRRETNDYRRGYPERPELAARRWNDRPELAARPSHDRPELADHRSVERSNSVVMTGRNCPPNPYIEPIKKAGLRVERVGGGADDAASGADRRSAGLGSSGALVGVPPEIVATFAASPRFGEGWCKSWLTPCSFDPDARALHPRTEVARRRLSQEAGRDLADIGVVVGVAGGLPVGGAA